MYVDLNIVDTTHGLRSPATDSPPLRRLTGLPEVFVASIASAMITDGVVPIRDPAGSGQSPTENRTLSHRCPNIQMPYSTTIKEHRFIVRALGLLLLIATNELGAEDTPEKSAPATYYQNPLSFSTQRSTDPPVYSRNAPDTGIESLLNASWLDFGLDYRFRYEYRDNDLRRPMASLDQPMLHRTRAYIGIRDILDPFRFAFEMQDSRRENSQFPRDNRDVNEFAVIRLYGELYFKNLLGHDPYGNNRPVNVRFGIQNFDYLDRRLLSNNDWRNTETAILE